MTKQQVMDSLCAKSGAHSSVVLRLLAKLRDLIDSQSDEGKTVTVPGVGRFVTLEDGAVVVVLATKAAK